MVEIQRAIASRAFARDVRWVPHDNLHLTVWFLGEVADGRVAGVLDALRPAMATPAIPLAIAGFGTFPRAASPRVLWMGVPEGVAELSSAHAEISARLRPLGFVSEARPYSAHLTLARFKGSLAAADRAVFREAVAAVDPGGGACLVSALTVFRSRTAPKGAVYQRLLRVPLS